MLNEQLKELVRREAETLYDVLNEKAQEVDSYDFGLPMANRQTQPIVDCLTQYAEKWQEAQQLVDRYEKWLDPIIEWGQIQGFPPGTEITNEVLHRAKEYAELKAKVEWYEKALSGFANRLNEVCGQNGIITAGIHFIIDDMLMFPLTPKTGSDDTING